MRKLCPACGRWHDPDVTCEAAQEKEDELDRVARCELMRLAAVEGNFTVEREENGLVVTCWPGNWQAVVNSSVFAVWVRETEECPHCWQRMPFQRGQAATLMQRAALPLLREYASMREFLAARTAGKEPTELDPPPEPRPPSKVIHGKTRAEELE